MLLGQVIYNTQNTQHARISHGIEQLSPTRVRMQPESTESVGLD